MNFNHLDRCGGRLPFKILFRDRVNLPRGVRSKMPPRISLVRGVQLSIEFWKHSLPLTIFYAL